MPGAYSWRDLHPRTFRYVAVVGAPDGSTLHVDVVSTGEAAAWAPPQIDHQGVFGLRPAASYSAVEVLVWDRLGGIRTVPSP
jgi:hypothetical protein